MELYEAAQSLGWNLSAYGYMSSSVDTSNSEASKLQVQADELLSRLDQAFTPVELMLVQMAHADFEVLFSASELRPYKFAFSP